MTRKDEFLRAIQLEPFRRNYDLPLAFGLALNLADENVPRDLSVGARKFVAGISSIQGANRVPGPGKKEPV